jgi:antitoxin MazE
MQIQIQKWGNSLGLRIPKSFAKEIQIDQGTIVEISLEDGRIVITPSNKPKYKLEDLLSGINKNNIHKEVKTGAIVGKEKI